MHAAFLIAALCAAGADDLDDLQGTWKLVRADLGLAEDVVKAADEGEITIRGDRFTRSSTTVLSGTLRLDPTERPGRFEKTTQSKGDKQPLTTRGIYRLDQDTFTQCSTGLRKEPPADFESRPGTGDSLLVWERIDRGGAMAGGDQDRLEGRWRLASRTFGGRRSREEDLRGVTFTYRAGEYIQRNTATLQGTVRVGRDGDRREIDLMMAGAEATGRGFRGLYRREGDRLMLLLNLASRERPAQFNEKPGPRQGLYVYERADPQP
jgi:uncharacterized protein (TIGR03067 family)